MPQFYQPSPIPINNFNFFIVGLLFSSGLSYVYAYAIAFSQHNLFDFLAMFMFVSSLGIGYRILSKFTLNEYKIPKLTVAFCLSIITVYTMWGFYIYHALQIKFPNENIDLIHYFTPSNLYDMVMELYSNGERNLHPFGKGNYPSIKYTHTDGSTLLIYWVLEALFILIFPLILLRKQRSGPKGKHSLQWYNCYEITISYETIYDVTPFLTTTDFTKTLKQLKSGAMGRSGKVYLFYHKMEQEQYLFIQNTYVTAYGPALHGYPKLNFLQISKEQAEQIKSEIDTKRIYLFGI